VQFYTKIYSVVNHQSDAGKEAENVNEWEWLTDTIPIGQRDAVSMSHLARVHNLSDRKMRREVEKARKAGNLICSSDKGYFMPETIADIREYASREGARIRTGRACLKPFLRELRRAGIG
jgi:hypothetical protein